MMNGFQRNTLKPLITSILNIPLDDVFAQWRRGLEPILSVKDDKVELSLYGVVN